MELTATEAERARSGALRRETLRAGVMGAACLACVLALGVAMTEALTEVRRVVRALGPDGLADLRGLVAEVYVFGGDASVPPRLGLIMVAYCCLLRCGTSGCRMGGGRNEWGRRKEKRDAI